MRILFLVSRDWTHPQATGGDQCTCDYARYLARQGHDVTLIAARYEGAAAQATMDGVRVVRPGGMPLLALHAAAYYLRHRADFDVVYEEAMASVRIPFLAPLYVRKPVVGIWYQVNRGLFDEQYPPLLAKIMGFGERLVLKLHQNTQTIALSRDRVRELIAEGLPRERITIVPPLMLDSQRAAPTGAAREPLIVWIGKIRRYKCAHHAVEAMPEVLRTVPDARLVIAGRRDDEEYEHELLETAERLGVRDHVELRLNITDDEKFDLLSRARALTVTSPLEGFSIVIVEANRCETPVVATSGVPVDTAKDGYNALRVPFDDPTALADALSRLLSDDALFEMLSRNGRDLADQFSVAQTGRWLDHTVELASEELREAA
jgi:glycosyltransferase involved in cell wall biosynthesis